ncbi:MAG: Uma2 family endonuclease [Cyanothece sp. SIO1E1]|nr:Uma2 family endonuclease [Cyanothece sp. SIO1E1]
MITLNLLPTLQLTDEILVQLCCSNPDLRLERTAQGELIAMSPVGSESGYYNADLSGQLWLWNRKQQLGVTFDSSAGFSLPNGAIRSPDAAWIEKTRWQRLPPTQRRKFAPICPDFVIELRSPSDDLETLKAKMQEYIDNGAKLGWLIDPEPCQVYCYRPRQTIQILNRPATLSGEDLLPGFVIELELVWGS